MTDLEGILKAPPEENAPWVHLALRRILENQVLILKSLAGLTDALLKLDGSNDSKAEKSPSIQ